MRIVRPTTEDDTIATFLSGELDSARFGDRVLGALKKHNADPRVVASPNLDDDAENELRRKLLRTARGYGSGKSWFAGWPHDVQWFRALCDRRELANVRYIVYSYWIELTGGTLRAGDAPAVIRSGKEIFGVSNKPFLDLSVAIGEGHQLPPMILVGVDETDLVVVEGHSRLTGYVLAGEKAPEEVEVIVGLSPDFQHWKMYSFDAYNALH